MTLKWREITPCTQVHLGRTCEGEEGHGGEHWITVWAVTQSEDGGWESYPDHPEYWKAK